MRGMRAADPYWSGYQSHGVRRPLRGLTRLLARYRGRHTVGAAHRQAPACEAGGDTVPARGEWMQSPLGGYPPGATWERRTMG